MRHALFDLRDLFIGLQRGLATSSFPASSGMLTTLLADWERPEADELRPEVEAMATPERGEGEVEGSRVGMKSGQDVSDQPPRG